MSGMNKIRMFSIIFIFYTLFAVNSYAQDVEFRELENKSFAAGEKLIYSVRYGFIPAGTAEISVDASREMFGREILHTKLLVKSLESFDWIYSVRTTYESYIDKLGLFPWRFALHIRESKFKADFSAFFDQRRGKAITSEGKYDIPLYAQDVVSAFYYARTLDYSGMEKGDKITLVNFYNDSVHNLDVIYLGKETVSVESGTFDCIVVEPLVTEGGFFKSEGNIMLFMTDDDLKIPVQVKIKVIIGALTVELTDFEGLAGEITSKK